MALTIQTRLAMAVTEAIKALDLQGTPDVAGSIGASVYNQVIPEALKAESAGLPAILVETVRRPSQEGDGGDFEERYVVYRIRCWILDQMRINCQEVQNDYTSWLHELGVYFDGLVNYPLFRSVTECHDVRAQDQIVLQEEAARDTLVKGYIDIDCHTNERRVRVGNAP